MTTLPEEPASSASYVRHMLMHRHPEHFMSFVDLFAMGCLLHLQGERCAGYKLVAQVLDKAADPAAKRYVMHLLNNLCGNELRFAREIEADLEMIQLCDRAQIKPAYREAACAR